MDSYAKYFWKGCKEGKIMYQHCPNCGGNQFYPRPFCLACGQRDPQWVSSAGYGTVYAYTEIYRAVSPQFEDITPYSIVMVDLDEGVRIMAHGAKGLKIDDRVKASFRDHGQFTLPFFIGA